MNPPPEWLRRPWAKQPLVVAVVVIAAVAVIFVVVVPVTDLIASHDVALITGKPRAAALQTAREAVRTQMVTLGAGLFAAGALAYTARNFRLSRDTFKATEKRVLNERFIAITAQLGHAQAAVRLAGVHAMAGLADDWEENRQTCIDVLCAYLRIPYAPDPGTDSPAAERLAFGADREVRHTVIRVVTAHLKGGAAPSWEGRNFDFTGVVFDGGSSFSGASFSSGHVDFSGAKFTDDFVDFSSAKFSGATVNFVGAEFSNGATLFTHAEFSGGDVNFFGAKFTGGSLLFLYTYFSGATVHFLSAKFSSGSLYFASYFSGGSVSFVTASFLGSELDFSVAKSWKRPPWFPESDTPLVGLKLPPQGQAHPVDIPGEE